jgi:geranylgeranyl diphosphate synthase type I
MDFMSDFTSHRAAITAYLTEFLAKKKQGFSHSAFGKDVFSRLTPLATGGKMLRGSLLINTYEKLSGKSCTSEALAAAVALELAGTSFLIHDDIIDQDELRRGQQTLHVQYAVRAKQQQYPQSQQMGQNLAICVGDLLFFLVYELLSTELIKLFSQQLSLTALGEMHDIELALMSGKQVKKEDILQMYTDKTASYTISLPLMAGAVLAGKNQQVVNQLNKIGQILGVIFQIKDDELGLFGDSKKIGKSVGADIREGKKTLYYYYLLQESEDRQNLMNTFGNSKIDETDIKKVMQQIEKYKVKEMVDRDLIELSSQVKELLQKMDINDEALELLVEFSALNFNRKK